MKNEIEFRGIVAQNITMYRKAAGLTQLELAEKLSKIIPSAELMRFCLDGSEAVHTAFRIARAKTGKQKFLRFEGQYHGWLDNVCWGNSAPSLEALGSSTTPLSSSASVTLVSNS